MTTPKPRAGRRPFDPGAPSLLEVLHQISKVCGMCADHRAIWCPACWGFGGCAICHDTGQVQCPDCAGGDLLPLCW
ncbi:MULTISPECIES: hypothetical protein [unclassified Streptomyces]|uniref:hypothetical protein n=1 Tax=unclassified Streptomyces TaxID=2593676 RepID=UPI003D8EBB55